MTTRTSIKLATLLFALLLISSGAFASDYVADEIYPHKDINDPLPLPTDGPQWSLILMPPYQVPQMRSIGNIGIDPIGPMPAWATKVIERIPGANY